MYAYVCISLACIFNMLISSTLQMFVDPPSGAFCVSVSILTCIFNMYQFEQFCILKCLCINACVNAAMHGDT